MFDLHLQQRHLKFLEREMNVRHVIFDSLILGLASPEQIDAWTQRRLSNGSIVGEVVNAKTVDYKTSKPLRGGLCCERIFGPTRDFICACGKRQPTADTEFCSVCEVEYGLRILRRRRLGYIQLFSGVTHIWYLKSRPNYIGSLLARPNKHIDTLVYCATTLLDAHRAGVLPPPRTPLGGRPPYVPGQSVPTLPTTCCEPLHKPMYMHYITSLAYEDDLPMPAYLDVDVRHIRPDPDAYFQVPDDQLFSDMVASYARSRQRGMQALLHSTGGDAVSTLLGRLNLPRLLRLLAYELDRTVAREVRGSPPDPLWDARPRRGAVERWALRKQQRVVARLVKRRIADGRRYAIAQMFVRANKNPAWMVLSKVPVLPPDVRPIVVVKEQLAASDLNRLYQMVMFRNFRMKEFRVFDFDFIGYIKRLVQEAVDSLLDNGRGRLAPVMRYDNLPLASITSRLKGKKGRFRWNLLGKRVDYSGRSVIVVGPKMRVDSCGLPREMALTLFAPFLIRRLVEKGFVDTTLRAKQLCKQHSSIIWPVLREVMSEVPVLLNRAPTLHRLGIQAFRPVLVAGKAIRLHPLVCTGFNADFDGDQMGVHVPLSYYARAEAWKLLWSRNNILAPALGDPILVPTQDMLLGCYYMTTDRDPERTMGLGAAQAFATPTEVVQAFSRGHMTLQAPIWLNLPLSVTPQTATASTYPHELQLTADAGGMRLTAARHDRLIYHLSTDRARFLTAYTQVAYQYTRTTVGRVLLNEAMLCTELHMPPLQRRIYKKKLAKTLPSVWGAMDPRFTSTGPSPLLEYPGTTPLPIFDWLVEKRRTQQASVDAYMARYMSAQDADYRGDSRGDSRRDPLRDAKRMTESAVREAIEDTFEDVPSDPDEFLPE